MSENQKKQIESKPKKINILNNIDDLKTKYCRNLEKEMEYKGQIAGGNK